MVGLLWLDKKWGAEMPVSVASCVLADAGQALD